jgi:hypothetical protein
MRDGREAVQIDILISPNFERQDKTFFLRNAFFAFQARGEWWFNSRAPS